MRIYEGSPRQDFEEVFRSIGAFLDSRGMRDILVLEVAEGFVVQGLVAAGTASASAWSETVGTITKETLSFFDDDIAKFMEEAAARRGNPAPDDPGVGAHERALRVVGRWIDEQKPKDASSIQAIAPLSAGVPAAAEPAAAAVDAAPTSGWGDNPG